VICVKLSDFERVGRGRRTRYIVPVRDNTGVEEFELIAAGDGKLVRRVFDKAEFRTEIQPKLENEAWEEELRRARELQLEAFDERSRLEDLPRFFKKLPPPPSPDDSVFASLHRTSGTGTTFSVSVSNFFLPAGTRLFFALPPICDCIGVVRPSSGDQDLFLNRDWPFFGPILASSIDPGTAVDVVIVIMLGCTLFSQFVPWFQVLGFSSGTCANFSASGRDVFG
jgi:hypothetical protein